LTTNFGSSNAENRRTGNISWQSAGGARKKGLNLVGNRLIDGLSTIKLQGIVSKSNNKGENIYMTN